jgi:hypothetical protein
MSLITPYILHNVREQKYLELIATALSDNREKQRVDARLTLTGKTVTVYEGGRLVGKLEHCEIGDSTATVCFTLLERGADDTIAKSISITPNMCIFWMDAQ